MKKSKQLKSRAIIVLAVLTAATVGVAVWLFTVQTKRFSFYQKKVVDQLTYETTVKAERGDILDCNGDPIATNIKTYRIFISPQDIIDAKRKAAETGDTEKTDIDVKIAKGLSSICGVSYESILEMTTRVGSKDATILSAADKEISDKVIAFANENGYTQMVYSRSGSTRYYIYSDLASHVIGFTGTDGTGLYGLEYQYNDYLSGTDGRYITARDSYGNEMPYEYQSYIDAEDGCTLNTTLNIKVQSILEEQLEKAYYESGSQAGAFGIVMNVKTGAVLAMANYPDYDPNNAWTLSDVYAEQLKASGYTEGTSQYNNMRSSLLLQMWNNKAVSYTYIPGSTFKIITTVAGLESAKVTKSEKFTCTGSIRVADRLVHCHNLYGHGNVTFAEGLQQSCNPVLITVGLRMGTSLFYSYVKNFGYLEKSSIDLPGEGTTIFWDEDRFTEIDLAMASFGQNFKMSPIRHLTSIAAVANGGYLVEPYIVESITDSDGNTVWKHDSSALRQAASSSVCSEVAEILREGVAGNGGSRNAYVAGYRVAAKTGTSEKIGDDEELSVCSCVAFAPADDPEIAMIFIVDEPTKGAIFGSVWAAPYVSSCLEEMLPVLGVEPVYTDAEAQKLEVAVGEYRGSVSYTAKAKIEKSGLACEVIGVGTVVTAQCPEAGTSLAKDSGKVILYVGDSAPENNIRIPDVTGMSATASQQVLINAGLNVKVSGATNYSSAAGATVFSQYPAAGSIASKGDIVEITLRYLNITDG